MPGLDNIISESFSTRLQRDLGQGTLYRIKNDLMQKHGITLNDSIETNYEIFNNILIEIFGKKASKEIQKKCLSDIFKIHKGSKTAKIYSHDHALCSTILGSYADSVQSSIMFSVLDKPKCFQDIFSEYDIPNTTFYRKANQLITMGLIVEVLGNYKWKDKTVTRYKSLFSTINASFDQSLNTVQGIISNETISNSLILKILD